MTLPALMHAGTELAAATLGTGAWLLTFLMIASGPRRAAAPHRRRR